MADYISQLHPVEDIRIMVVRCARGSGKTAKLLECVEEARANGERVLVVSKSKHKIERADND